MCNERVQVAPAKFPEKPKPEAPARDRKKSLEEKEAKEKKGK